MLSSCLARRAGRHHTSRAHLLKSTSVRARGASYNHAPAPAAGAFEQLVGNTRLVRLRGPSQKTGCDIYGKLETDNPGGSVKDRAALYIVRDALARGILSTERGTENIIVEGTAGNTGIGLALVSRQLGFECVIVLADTQSAEKKATLRAYGARLIEVPAVPFRDPNNYVHVAERLAAALREQRPGAEVLYANQWDNLANRRAHAEGTGPELVGQLARMGKRLDAFSCAVGTGGTLAGVAQYLREDCFRPDGRDAPLVCLTDPEGAALFRYYRDGVLKSSGASLSEGVGQGRITGNLEGFVPDLAFEISDREMLPVLHALQAEEGLALGGSAGINVCGAMAVARHLGPGHTVATVLCDGAMRYATKLYDVEFLKERDLPPPPWLDRSTLDDLGESLSTVSKEVLTK